MSLSPPSFGGPSSVCDVTETSLPSFPPVTTGAFFGLVVTGGAAFGTTFSIGALEGGGGTEGVTGAGGGMGRTGEIEGRFGSRGKRDGGPAVASGRGRLAAEEGAGVAAWGMKGSAPAAAGTSGSLPLTSRTWFATSLSMPPAGAGLSGGGEALAVAGPAPGCCADGGCCWRPDVSLESKSPCSLTGRPSCWLGEGRLAEPL